MKTPLVLDLRTAEHAIKYLCCTASTLPDQPLHFKHMKPQQGEPLS